MTDLADYKKLYLKSARKHLKILSKNIALFLKNPSNQSVLDQAHLHTHSLKSQSLVMGYPKTGALCRSLETIFYKIKERKKILTNANIKSIQISLQQLTELIQLIEKTGQETRGKYGFDI